MSADVDGKERLEFDAPGKTVSFLLCLTAVILRRPDAVWTPQFWAEDGIAFWTPVYLGKSSIFLPYNNYLHVIPRIVAAIAGLAGSYYAPMIYNGAAIFIASLSIWLFYLPPARSLVHSDWIRLILCLLFIMGQPSYEAVNILTNVQWWTSVGALILLCVPITWFWSIPAAAFALLAALSSATCVLFVPIAVFFLAMRKYNHYAVSLSLIMGCCIQFLVCGLPAAGHGAFALDPNHQAVIILDHVCASVLVAFPGFQTARWLDGSLYVLNFLLAALVLLFVGLINYRGNRRILLVSLYLLATLAAAPVIGRSIPMSSDSFFTYPSPNCGRYLLVPFAVVLFLLGKTLEQLWESRRISLNTTCLTILAAFAIVVGGRVEVPPFVDMQWGRYAELFDARKITEAPMNPPGFFIRTYLFGERARREK